MSVIARDPSTGTIRTFVKGSPEAIRDLSIRESIPANFNQVLESYTNQGYRVLGLGVRELPDLSSIQTLT